MKSQGQKKEPLQRLKPMLAELIDEPFDDDGWLFEVKYDGYRALASIDKKKNVDLYSRNFISFNERFAPIVEELEKIGHQVIIDGEIVIEDTKGISRFQLLQNYQKTGEGILRYYVFDILHLDGKSTRDLPLSDRKELLQLLLQRAKLKNIFYSDHVRNEGKKFYRLAIKRKLEGIIAKDASGIYEVGKRNGSWKKVKITRQQEAVIAGVTAPQGGRKNFGSLILGAYHKKQLEYIGNCGTGFSEIVLKELYDKFKPYFITSSPFNERIKTKGKVQWMKPHFVCEVKFSEWTDDMHMRHPVYLGLRIDKKASVVVPELPKGTSWQSRKKK